MSLLNTDSGRDACSEEKFFERKKREVRGVVQRFGYHLNKEGRPGFVFVLQGDAQVYRMEQGGFPSSYPAGLTSTGDQVSFLATDSGFVVVRDFVNETWNSEVPPAENASA